MSIKFTGKRSTHELIKRAYRWMRSVDPAQADLLNRTDWKLIDETAPIFDFYNRVRAGMFGPESEALGASHASCTREVCEYTNCPGAHTLIFAGPIQRFARKWQLSLDKATALVLAHEHTHMRGIADERPCIEASYRHALTWPRGRERDNALAACLDSLRSVTDDGEWARAA